MRHTFLKLSLLAVSATMFAGGCSKSEQTNPEENMPIAFGTQITKAPVTAPKEMNDFSVWGWCYKPDTQHANLFNATTVHPDGSYEDGGTRFWADGFTYDFYAVHPTTAAVHPATMQMTENGILTVTDFDASKTGNEAIDLMTASNTGIVYVQDTDPATRPAPVSLDFRHELAQVTFSVVTEENCRVNALLIRAAYKGDLTRNLSDGTSQWTYKACSKPNGVPYQEPFTTKIPEENPTVIFGGPLLLPPQGLEEGTQEIYPGRSRAVYITVGWRYEGTTEQPNRDIILQEIVGADGNAITRWEAGKRYNYVIKIPKQGNDIDMTVQVEDWNNQDMSVVL